MVTRLRGGIVRDPDNVLSFTTMRGDDFGSFCLSFANFGFLILVSFTFFRTIGSGFNVKDSDFDPLTFVGPGS